MKKLKEILRCLPSNALRATAGLALLAGISFIAPKILYAETPTSKRYTFEASIENVMPFQNGGLEEKLGTTGGLSEEILSQESISEEGVLTQDINDKYFINAQPLNQEITNRLVNIRPRLDFYIPSKLGFHINALQLAGSGSKEEALFREASENSDSENFYFGIVSLWDSSFASFSYEGNTLFNEEELMFSIEGSPMENLPTEYKISRDFKLFNSNLFASIPVSDYIKILGGLRFLKYDIKDLQKIGLTFHIIGNYDEYYLDGFEFHSTEDFYNQVSLELTSDVNAWGLGPFGGLAFSRNNKRIGLRGELHGGLVRLFSKRNSLLKDIDDIYYTYFEEQIDSEGTTTTTETETKEYDEGKMPFDFKERTFSPFAELDFNLEVFLTKNLSVYAGYWASLIKSLPMPARFHYRRLDPFGEYPTIEEFWELHKKDAFFNGIKLGARVKY